MDVRSFLLGHFPSSGGGRFRDPSPLPPLPDAAVDLVPGDAVPDQPEGNAELGLHVGVAGLVVEEEHVGEGHLAAGALAPGRFLNAPEVRHLAAGEDLQVHEVVDGLDGFGCGWVFRR